MKRAQLFNLMNQSFRAEQTFARHMEIARSYQEQFPQYIIIIQDEIQLKDMKHFQNWKKEQGL